MPPKKKTHFKVKKATRKQQGGCASQSPDSLGFPVEFSSLAKDFQRRRSVTGAGNTKSDVGFLCRIVDKPYEGASPHRCKTGIRGPSALNDMSHHCWVHASSPSKTPLPKADCDPSGHQPVGGNQRPDHMEIRLNDNGATRSCLPGGSDHRAAAGVLAGKEYRRNIRRGTKIVHGTVSKNSAECAVRVFIIDDQMLEDLSKNCGFTTRTSSANLDATEPSDVTSPTLQVRRQSGSHNAIASSQGGDAPREGGGGSHVVLPQFPHLLERYLRRIFLFQETDPFWCEGGSAAGCEDTEVVRSNTPIVSDKKERAPGETCAEFFLSPQRTSRPTVAKLKRELVSDASNLQCLVPPLRMLECASGNSFPVMRNAGGTMDTLTDPARWCSTDTSFTEQSAMIFRHQEMEATVAYNTVRDSDIVGTVPVSSCSGNKNNDPMSTVTNGSMPVLGLSVFMISNEESLDAVCDDVAAEAVEATGPHTCTSKSTDATAGTTRAVRSVPTAHGTRKGSTKSSNAPERTKSPLNKVLGSDFRSVSCGQKKLSDASPVTQKGPMGVRKLPSTFSALKKDKYKFVDCFERLDYRRPSLPKRSGGSTEDGNASGAGTRSTAISSDHVNHTQSQHGNKSLPRIAVVLSLPFVQQGNVHDVFFRWVLASRPTNQLREAVIRNIMRCILNHLAVLHSKGIAHGSVKATNIFFTPHVMEAIAAARDCSGSMTTSTRGFGNFSVNTETSCGGFKKHNSNYYMSGHSKCSARSDDTEMLDGAATSTGTSAREINSNPDDGRDMLELSNHVILADGYYGDVERALSITFANCTNMSSSRHNDGSSSHDKETSISVPIVDEPLTPFGSPKNTNKFCEVNELHLFTVKEQEYLPPPECIVCENKSNGNKKSCVLAKGNLKKTMASPSPRDGEGDETNEGNTSRHMEQVRTTHSTHNPRCPLSPAHDIWMLGMLAIHLADGGSPWWMRFHHKPLPRLRRGKWSLSFASLVQRCACAAEDQRPTAEELLQDKWFDCALLDNNGEEVKKAFATTSPQQPQHCSGAINTPLKRPCHRAFVDIMLGYHELAEEWCGRYQSTNPNHSLLGCGDFPSSLDNKKKDICSFSMMEEERVRKDDKKQASGVLKPTTTAAGGSGSHAYRSHNNDGDATEEGRSQTAASESERHRLLVSGKEEEGKIDYSNGKEATALEGDDMHLGEDRDSDTDAGNTASHLNKPCFLGALSVALESCGGGDYGDSDGHFTGGVSPYHNGEAYVFPSDKPSSGDGAQDCDSVPHPKHEELISELMQAFWNLHRECRLATDVWCATLMKYMKHDSRTQDYVMPLVTNETLPFFAEPGLPGAGHPNNRCGPTGGSASKMPTAAIGTEVTSATHKEEGSRVSFCSAQQPSDVSPTAFHNYMLGKWCVTTSWILQQQQPQQALKAASGSELKR